MPGAQKQTRADLGDVVAGFLEASHQIAPHLLAALITDAARELGADAARVWLADHQQRALMHLTPSKPREPLSIEGTAAGRAFISCGAIETAGEGDRAHLWLPLVDGVDRIGVLEVEIDGATDAQRDSLRHFASMATAEIITRGQYTDLFTVSRRMKPMSLAAELQWQSLPPGSFTTDDVSIGCMMEPAYDVGGDCFDYAHSEDRLDLAIFDAVGHDLGSSVISSLTLGVYRNCRRNNESLIDVGQAMDRVIQEQLGDARFVTGHLAVLDTSNGQLRFLNAGHPLPLLIRHGKVVGSIPCRPRLPFGLGRPDDRIPEVAEAQLEPGDGVFFYSDGVVEARRAGGEDFGVERLEQFLQTAFAAGLSPAETLRRLSNAVLDYHSGILRDDATTVLTVWHPEH